MTEYRYSLPNHTAPFTIEAIHCKRDEIPEYLKALLYSYRDFFNLSPKDETTQSDTENTEKYRMEKASKLALSTLQGIFPNQEESKPEYLEDNTEGAFERILTRLRSLANSLNWPDEDEYGNWSSTAITVADCREKVERFMASGIWPLTELVRYVPTGPYTVTVH